MSHSTPASKSDDLEQLHLTEEALAASPDNDNDNDNDIDIARPPPHSHRDPRRVSINSLNSNASTSTIKNRPQEQHHGAGIGSSSAGPNSRSSGARPTSGGSTSHAAALKRPKPSYRHSSTFLNTDTLTPGSRRRRAGTGSDRRPGSSRSSLRQKNRSSEDEDDDDYYAGEAEDYFADARSHNSRMRRPSRRSVLDHDRRSLEDREQYSDRSGGEDDDDDDDDGSDNEPLTLKDRQETLNQTHPFGLPLWKPALYKKSRSVIRKANSALHSQPSSDLYLSFGNVLWTLIFGWWLSLVCLLISIVLFLTPFGGRAYGRVVLGLSYYLLWPFGQYVERELSPGELKTDHWYSGASPSESNGNGDESRPLLSRTSSIIERERKADKRRRCIQSLRNLPRHIYHLGLGGIVYYMFYYLLIGPLHLFVSSLCWFMVVSIPMGKFTYVLATHMHRHPLRLNFKRGSSLSLSPQRSEILLCTYDAIGFQYYKYTYDGTNIIFINLMPVVLFTILDDYVLTHFLGHDSILTKPAVIFSLGLTSVIPLSYFIGMAVSSISAQSSLGMGAVINATFGSIIEIILYSVALTQGKGLITEGALIGSFLAGLLLMPGLSMMSGAVKKKEQRFNAKSAGVTATMLIMSLIGVLTPTLFYSIYGRFELRCTPCPESEPLPSGASCQRCYQHQPNPADDAFFQRNVKPLMYFCCIILPSAYLVGIWFSLRTHVKQIWHEPQQPSIRDSSIYRKLLPTHIVQQLLHYGTHAPSAAAPQRPAGAVGADAELGHGSEFPPLTTPGGGERRPPHSAPAAHSGASIGGGAPNVALHPAAHGLLSSLSMDHDSVKHYHDDDEDEEQGGHDSPNWSKAKSATVLLGCTVLYSIIAEILVDSVDAVSSIDEKLLGLTLFALVPNVTEFMNAISFAMYGNIALSMEIGSAYALQVCLIQIPAMVAISAWLNFGKEQIWKFTFNLIFPRWDVMSMLFSVFLLTYTYIEGKSNYFKGSILILSYLVLMAGFVYAPDSPGNGDVSFTMSP
ncbi:Ca2+:H+ antiporter [Entomortierella parvispora]|uniref:Ca2+:H+ antiporter n=1 Tax=Entomortierella parvispora TaxID=205924 RepID=A0A9P3H4V7_9FUNG|nr:Ca2+:H+ antiporter [Entomortierella parvispora]